MSGDMIRFIIWISISTTSTNSITILLMMTVAAHVLEFFLNAFILKHLLGYMATSDEPID